MRSPRRRSLRSPRIVAVIVIGLMLVLNGTGALASIVGSRVPVVWGGPKLAARVVKSALTTSSGRVSAAAAVYCSQIAKREGKCGKGRHIHRKRHKKHHKKKSVKGIHRHRHHPEFTG